MGDLDEAPKLPPFYAAVLATEGRLMDEFPDGFSFELLGTEAWCSLTRDQQAQAWPYVLGSYVRDVHEEQRSLRLDREARDTAHTYLGDFDTTIIWDSLHAKPNEHDEVAANRQSLLNVICELELLQHRLAMRDAEHEGERTT